MTDRLRRMQRLIRLHRRALRAWRTADFNSLPFQARLLHLDWARRLGDTAWPGVTLGLIYESWN